MAAERLLLIPSPATASPQRGGPSCCQRSCSPGRAALQGGARASCLEVLTRQKPLLKMSSYCIHQGPDWCCLLARLCITGAVQGLVWSRGSLSGAVFLQGEPFPHFVCSSECSACRPGRTSYLALLVMGCLPAKPSQQCWRLCFPHLKVAAFLKPHLFFFPLISGPFLDSHGTWGFHGSVCPHRVSGAGFPFDLKGSYEIRWRSKLLH